MPIPVGLHPGSGGIHNIEKQYGIWGGVDDSVFSELLQSIKSMTIPPTRNITPGNITFFKTIIFLEK